MEFDHSSFRGMYQEQNLARPNPEDARLFVKFHIRPMLNEERSRQEGRPIFDDAEMITIAVPGDRDTVVVRRVTQKDKQRFASAYAHWKDSTKELAEGTPLEQWPEIPRSQAEELRYFNVRTVEQLAQMSDGNAQKFPGILALRQRAQAYLARVNEAAPLSRLQAELDKRDAELATLKKIVEDQAKALDKLDKRRL